MSGMQKIAENEARDDDVRVVIDNSYSVTVERDGDRVMLSSEIMVDDDGYSDGSIIDLNIDYEWESGQSVSDSDKAMLRHKLAQASHVLDAGFRFRIIPK
jgi:hypothetical protein